MKRLLIATFLFLYTGFTVVMAAEHTSSWASAFAAGKSQPSAKWMPSPHPSKTRSVEHPFVVPRIHAESPLILAETNTHAACAQIHVDNIDQRILARAPPRLS